MVMTDDMVRQARLLDNIMTDDMVRQARQLDNFMTDDMMNIKMLGISVPGVPGDDFPILAEVPQTSFRLELSAFFVKIIFHISYIFQLR